jgi:hypothetical protein
MEIFTSPSKRKRVLDGSSASLMRTVNPEQRKSVASD